MTLPARRENYGNLLAWALLVGFFSVCVRVPLSHTDLWGHLAYGRYYSETGRFPPAEPFLKLSHDEPFVSNSWLTQWLGFRIHQAAGPFGLQLSYAILCTILFASVYWLTVRETGEPLIGFVAMLLFGSLEYQQLIIVRPQLAGMVCFCLMLHVLRARDSGTWRNGKLCLMAGILILVWANLHGSFALGPVTIGMIGAGELLDRLRRQNSETSRSLKPVVLDTVVLLAIALVAGLINPYGLALYREVVTFSSSPNLYNLIEWKPLWSTPKQGTTFVVAVILGIVTIKFSKKKMRWRDWLPVLVLAVMTAKTSRYIVWFAPLYVVALAPHLKSLLEGAVSRSERFRKFRGFLHRETPAGRPLIVLMIAVALFADSFFRSSPYSSQTPIGATEKLLEVPEQVLILNTMDWGDWMIWRSRASLPVFVNSHVTYIPPEVWQDYMTLIKLKPGWEAVLEKYPFSAAVLQNGRQRRLIRHFEENPAWTRIYRDEIAVIFLLTGNE